MDRDRRLTESDQIPKTQNGNDSWFDCRQMWYSSKQPNQPIILNSQKNQICQVKVYFPHRLTGNDTTCVTLVSGKVETTSMVRKSKGSQHNPWCNKDIRFSCIGTLLSTLQVSLNHGQFTGDLCCTTRLVRGLGTAVSSTHSIVTHIKNRETIQNYEIILSKNRLFLSTNKTKFIDLIRAGISVTF